MKISFINISLVFSLFLLSSCDKSHSELIKNDNNFKKESLNLLNYKETPKLIINGPFTKTEKIKASKILAVILCKNEKLKVNLDKNLIIENQFKKEISEIALERGIEYSPQVLKTGIKLKEYLIADCSTFSISERDEEDIYLKNFRFNK